MNLEQLMNQYNGDLNMNEIQTLQYIMENTNTCCNDSCQMLADKCNISRATLLRTCRKIGLTSFADLKLVLKDSRFKGVSSSENTSMDAVCKLYHLMIDELQKLTYNDICKQIYTANTVYIYGTGNEQKVLADEFKKIFLSVGKCVIDLFDYGEVAFAKSSFNKDDLFVIISLSGETQNGIEILKLITASDINTLSITKLANNSIARLCKQNLYVATQVIDESKYDSYELVAVFYVLLDILFIKYLEYIKRKRI